MELSLTETYAEWQKFFANGETTLPYLEWMRFNGLDIDGSRYEYRTI